MKNRQRGRNGGKPRPPGGGPRPNFDGGMRPRGNAQQLMEKFLAMARDASSMGDRVAAENYYQHADHYYRVLNARFEAQQQQQQQHQHQHQQHQQQQGYNNGQRRPDQGQRFDRGYQGEGQGDDQPGDRPNYDQRPNYDSRPSYDQRPAYQGEQPRTDAEFQNAAPPAQPAYPPQPSRDAPEGDIGLPPQILGMQEDSAPEPGEPGGSGPGDGGEGRHPRRRRGRGGPGGPRHPGGEPPARDQ